jgi:tetratricopeptide (TPR) repeat protein
LNHWLKAAWFRFVGRRRLHSEEYQLALENFLKAAELEPDSLYTRTQIGWCLYKLKDYQAAIDKYESAMPQLRSI